MSCPTVVYLCVYGNNFPEYDVPSAYDDRPSAFDATRRADRDDVSWALLVRSTSNDRIA